MNHCLNVSTPLVVQDGGRQTVVMFDKGTPVELVQESRKVDGDGETCDMLVGIRKLLARETPMWLVSEVKP